MVATSSVENVIGTAFADVIVGSPGANKIYGGGGDVIEGKGGADEIFGGGEGDYLEDSSSGTAYGGKGTNNCVGFSSKNECSGSETKVRQHEPTSTMSAGLMMLKNPVGSYDTAYMTGTGGEDKVNAHYVSASHEVTFTSTGATKFGGESEGCTYEEGGKIVSEGRVAKCPLPAATPTLDAVVMAGLKGPDKLTVSGEPKFLATATPILLGGEGDDILVGSNTTEDALVDGNGTGADILEAFSFDDLLTNNQGVDKLEGGPGNDLLLSTTVCDGDTLQGGEEGKDDGEAKNDASWTKLPAPQGVTADIATQSAGSSFNEAAEAPACSTGATNNLFGIDDLEGSNQNDALLGGETANLLLPHLGEDNVEGAGGDDKINSIDGVKDKVGGGAQTNFDLCIVDLNVDEVNGCEEIEPKPETKTTIAKPVPHNGAPGSVDVKGNVAANQTVQGFHVFLEYEKEEGGSFKLKAKPEAKLDANGNYVNSEGVGKGKWQVRAVFPAQADYKPSSSEYQPFTIE